MWCARDTTSILPVLVSALALAAALCLPQGVRGAAPLPERWIDQLMAFVLTQKSMEHEGSFEPYLGQLALMRQKLRHHDVHGTYLAVNRFMDMLERREGGIRPEVAEAIWDYCYQITPVAFHDDTRHKRWWDKSVDWEQFFWEE